MNTKEKIRGIHHNVVRKRNLDFGTDSIMKILLKLAPPVVIAQLIQALYNIVDSLFIGRYSEEGLTALSIIYPVQLFMIALAVGSGVGINTLMASYAGMGKSEQEKKTAGTATTIGVVLWALFAISTYCLLPFYAGISSDSAVVVEYVIEYGRIVCVFSFGLFLESLWTKVLQAEGNMLTPMCAQIGGAVLNMIFDAILIFGIGAIPALGIKGAAIATVMGQIFAAMIVSVKGWRKSPRIREYKEIIKKIYYLGFPNIVMQAAYTFYILGLNLILSTFSDDAVTALGLYYKWQTFFFIPLGALQTCIVPIISYNYAAKKIERCRNALKQSFVMGMVLMFTGTLCFELIPGQLLRVFSQNENVITIGTVGFRWIGISFIPMVTSLIFPVFFQASGHVMKSTMLTILRTIILFIPLGYLFSRFGLEYFWITFPVTEFITSVVGGFLYHMFSQDQEELI